MTLWVWSRIVAAGVVFGLGVPVVGSADAGGARPAAQSTIVPDDDGGVGAGVGGLVAIAMGLVATEAASYPTELLVEPPRGPLGPQTSTAIDPATISGIAFNGVRWIIAGGVTFDEQTAGGYLEFDAPALVVGPGVSIDGARFVDVDSGSGPVLSGERREDEFTIRHVAEMGGQGSSAIGGLGENVTLENFLILDFDGDGVKPASGWTVTDGRIRIRGIRSLAKHFDGIQVTGRFGVTLSRLEISMMSGGTAAVFVHDGRRERPPTVVHDIVVTHAPDVYRTLRFDETVVAYNLQGMGPVRPDRQPAAFTLTKRGADIDWSSVYSTFDVPVPVR